MSCIGNGYLSGNMLTAFPIEDGSFLDWGLPMEQAKALQASLQACFVDAGIFVDSAPSEEGWPAIGEFSIPESGDSLSFKISANGCSSVVSASASRIPFPIIFGKSDFGHYILSMSSEGIRGFCSLLRSFQDYTRILPLPSQDPHSSRLGRDGGVWLRLCAKCITFRQGGLTSLRVYDGRVSEGHSLENGPHFILTGNVAIRPGNNVKIEEPSGSNDGGNGFEMVAEPGAGLGRNECLCIKNEGGNNELAGPDGHSRIFNDTCYDLEPVGPSYLCRVDSFGRDMVTRDLKIHAKCTACCTCEMYGDIVDRLSKIADRARKARNGGGDSPGIYELLSNYENAVEEFRNRLSSPRLPDDVSMVISGMPAGKNVSPKMANADGKHEVLGAMDRCSFTVILKNESFFEIVAKPVSMSGDDVIIEATASWSGPDGSPLSVTRDSANEIMDMRFNIMPGRALLVTFISKKNNMSGNVGGVKFKGSAFFDISWIPNGSENESYLGRIGKSVEV